MRIEKLNLSHMELVMQVMLETKLPDFFMGCPLSFENGKIASLINKSKKDFDGFERKAFLFYDESNPKSQSIKVIDRGEDKRLTP